MVSALRVSDVIGANTMTCRIGYGSCGRETRAESESFLRNDARRASRVVWEAVSPPAGNRLGSQRMLMIFARIATSFDRIAGWFSHVTFPSTSTGAPGRPSSLSGSCEGRSIVQSDVGAELKGGSDGVERRHRVGD